MEDLSKLLEFARALIKIFREDRTLKISACTFMLSFFVFLSERIFNFYIIIVPMITAIKDFSILGMIISAGVMFSYVTVNAAEKALLKIKNKMLSEREKKMLMEAEKKKAEAVREKLNGLSRKEKAIMKYVLTHDGAAWLPCENIYALNLSRIGCLTAVNRLSTLRGLNSDNCSQCFGYVFSLNIKEYISEHKEELYKSWEEIPELREFDDYQED